MKHSIGLEELPRTFRDALHFTRDLGFRYIWIDSLCIIQDSNADWQQESAQMCHVYAKSYANISASAKNSTIGLFSLRNPRLLQPVTVRAKSIRTRVVDANIWRQQVEDAPLNQRAWVLQERLLSPRNLHFSKEIFWECNEATASETFPDRLLSLHGTTLFKKIAREGLQISQDLQQNHWLHAARRIHASWKHIVQKYSRSALTFESDNLVAIGGLAQSLQSALNDKYLAEIWQNQLVAQLLWFRKDKSFSKPKSYIAPSWSWASGNGAVEFWDPFAVQSAQCGPLISLESTNIDYKTSNLFGQVRSGSLCLYGKLFQITFVYNDDDMRDIPLIWADCLVHCCLLCQLDTQLLTGNHVQQKHMYGLPLVTNHDGEPQELYGLLLVSSSIAGQFQRVGTFNVFPEGAVLVKTGIQCFDGKAKDLGLEYIGDGQGGYKYLITLI